MAVLALLSLSCGACATESSATEALPSRSFSIEGTLTYEVPGQPVLRSHFTASVSNCLWHITMVLEGNNDFLSFEYHYDGTNALQYTLFKKSGPDEGSGLIEKGPVPSSTSSDGGVVVWLAYASGYYFHGLKGGTATSLEPLRGHGYFRRHEVPVAWKLASKEPFLPMEVSYFATNVAVLDAAGDVFSVPLEKPRAPKYVATHLRTWDPLSFQGQSIPRHFEYIAYGPWPRPGTPGRSCIVRGEATNVCPLIPFPALPSTLALQDNRLTKPRFRKVIDGRIPD